MQESLEWENDLLVDKLLKILHTPRKLKESTSGPRTLNARNRKIEILRINKDNERIA